jgi:hypothetical protein
MSDPDQFLDRADHALPQVGHHVIAAADGRVVVGEGFMLT